MGIMTKEVKDFVQRQKLGFVATVCPDGTPNLSPKGTVTVWDDDHLAFLDIYSPGTVENLSKNASIEINMVDVFIRRGFRFKGTAQVLSGGDLFNNILTTYGEGAKRYEVKNVILMHVDRVLEITSPAYAAGDTEEDLRKRYVKYWGGVHGF